LEKRRSMMAEWAEFLATPLTKAKSAPAKAV
jgi:hypothetical protein